MQHAAGARKITHIHVHPTYTYIHTYIQYAGGARNIADFERVKELGKGKVDLTIGRYWHVYIQI